MDPPEAPRPGRRRPLDLDRHRRLRPAAPRPRPRRRHPPALAAALPARPPHPRPGTEGVPPHPPGPACSRQRAETLPPGSRTTRRIEKPLGHGTGDLGVLHADHYWPCKRRQKFKLRLLVRRPEDHTTCTAVAPGVVFTVRRYGTRPLYGSRLVRKFSSHQLQTIRSAAPDTGHGQSWPNSGLGSIGVRTPTRPRARRIRPRPSPESSMSVRRMRLALDFARNLALRDWLAQVYAKAECSRQERPCDRRIDNPDVPHVRDS